MRHLTSALAAALVTFAAGQAGAQCASDQYLNSSGHCVHRSEFRSTQPPGAAAQCRDGTWSFSEHHQGTCSHHGGVARWL
jgi:hypothetical protein